MCKLELAWHLGVVVWQTSKGGSNKRSIMLSGDDDDDDESIGLGPEAFPNGVPVAAAAAVAVTAASAAELDPAMRGAPHTGERSDGAHAVLSAATAVQPPANSSPNSATQSPERAPAPTLMDRVKRIEETIGTDEAGHPLVDRVTNAAYQCVNFSLLTSPEWTSKKLHEKLKFLEDQLGM